MAPHRVLTRATRVPPARRPSWRALAAAITALLALLAGALTTVPAAAASPAPSAAPLPASERLSSFDAQMLSLINGARASAGVSGLSQSGGLTSLAVWWSTKMADGATGYQLQHNPDAWTMVTQYGASNRTAWAENVAGFSASATAQQVFDAYMGSADHRANILSSKYHYVGVGTVAGSKGAFNTMEFTDRVDGAPAPKPSTSKPAPTTSAKPAPTTSAKPAPSTKPAPKPSTSAKPAPSTKAAPRPSSTPVPAAPQTHAMEPAYSPQQAPAQHQDAPARQNTDNKPAAATPVAVRGTLTAAFGALGLPGMKVAIRNADCRGDATATATTQRNGRVSVQAKPGTYCAVAVSAPDGVKLPKATTFTVRSGHAFTVTWNRLDTATIWWSARGTSLRCPV